MEFVGLLVRFREWQLTAFTGPNKFSVNEEIDVWTL
jgi:hypothetical protein